MKSLTRAIIMVKRLHKHKWSLLFDRTGTVRFELCSKCVKPRIRID